MSKEIRYNKSKTYLLPLLSKIVPLEMKFVRFLQDTYMFDDMGKYENCIFILHDFSFKAPEFTSYEHRLTDSEAFVDLIDVGNQVVYIFKFPEEYLHEYNSFKDGKYSKFGIDAKELILDYWTTYYKNKVAAIPFLLKVKQILFKDANLKQKLEKELSSRKHEVKLDDDAELGSIIYEEHETFELSKYTKKENESQL